MPARTTIGDPGEAVARRGRRKMPMKISSTMRGAGAVLVGEEAAPVAGKAGLGDVGRLMDRKMREERDAEIAGGENDDCGDRQQPGKMFASVGQQQERRCLEDQ